MTQERGTLPAVQEIVNIPLFMLAGFLSIQSSVDPVEPNCYICRVTIAGEGQVFAARELNVEAGATARVSWSDRVTQKRGIRYELTCSIKPEASRARVVLRIRAFKSGRGAFYSSHTTNIEISKPRP